MKFIPYHGKVGSGNIPTGGIKIGPDWPGLFIRGDDAIELMKFLDWIKLNQQDPAFRIITTSIGHYADLIRNDVIGERGLTNEHA